MTCRYAPGGYSPHPAGSYSAQSGYSQGSRLLTRKETSAEVRRNARNDEMLVLTFAVLRRPGSSGRGSTRTARRRRRSSSRRVRPAPPSFRTSFADVVACCITALDPSASLSLPADLVSRSTVTRQLHRRAPCPDRRPQRQPFERLARRTDRILASPLHGRDLRPERLYLRGGPSTLLVYELERSDRNHDLAERLQLACVVVRTRDGPPRLHRASSLPARSRTRPLSPEC